MPTLTADPTAMTVLADRLAAAGEQLRSAGTTLPHAAGRTASRELADAVEAFCQAWRHSLHETGQAAEVAGERLRAAAEGYRQLEAAIAGVRV